jgi:hypothetical protein
MRAVALWSYGAAPANAISAIGTPLWPLPLIRQLQCLLPAVIANMRGDSPEEVASLLMQEEGLRGLQVSRGGCLEQQLVLC